VTAATTAEVERRFVPPPRERWWHLVVALVAIGVVCAVLLGAVEPINLRRLARVATLSLAVLGVNLATGRVGLVALGHGAFVGIGAFATVWLLDDVGAPFAVAVPGAFAITMAFGLVVGLPALRVGGLRLAMVTLSIAVLFPPVAKQFGALTGGAVGRPVSARLVPPDWTPWGPEDAIAYQFVIVVAVCVVAFVATRGILNCSVGRAMQAVRDGELAALTYGVDVGRVKLVTFAYSAALAGLAGSLQMILFPFASQADYGLFLSLQIYAGAVLGGLGSLAGAFYGVLVLILIPRLNDVLEWLDEDSLVFGIGLVALTFAAPDGVAGVVHQLRGRWRRSPRDAAPMAPAAAGN
jgi:branched-chain amino acid transport system permease protein